MKVDGIQINVDGETRGSGFTCAVSNECELAPGAHDLTVSWTRPSSSSENPEGWVKYGRFLAGCPVDGFSLLILCPAAAVTLGLYEGGKYILEKADQLSSGTCLTELAFQAEPAQRYEVTITQLAYNERPQSIDIDIFNTNEIAASGPCE